MVQDLELSLRDSKKNFEEKKIILENVFNVVKKIS